MSAAKIACVAGIFDTKGGALNYITDLIRAAGPRVRTVDPGTTGRGLADVRAAEVSPFQPNGADTVLEQADRGPPHWRCRTRLKITW